MEIEVTAFDYEDYQNLYGDRIVEIGKCFTNNDNIFYLQKKDHVLMLNMNSGLITTHHPGFLNDKNLNKISYKEFEIKAKEIIYRLELDKFWNK